MINHIPIVSHVGRVWQLAIPLSAVRLQWVQKLSTCLTYSRASKRSKSVDNSISLDSAGSVIRNRDKMVRILNVAEKNDAAKSLADIMSRGSFRKREGLSRFNKIYEFEYNLFNQNTLMSMTSVSGHLLNFEFIGQYKQWHGCNPVALFEAPVQKGCQENYLDIKRSLEREIRGCQTLIVWTDCDREGENIGFEVIQVCQQIKPNIRVLRARFSEITPQAVQRALNNLVEPDKNTSDAVDVRQELDLRIGAAFTRFQTLRLQKVFPNVLTDQLISYGSCQFPTLGFVVERYKQVQAFINEPFWKIKVSHEREECSVDFTWKRQRLFDQLACLVLYEHCLEKPEASVLDVKSKPKSKWRPAALDTVEMEKIASRKLRIGAKETMKIAEKLYTQGLISYPRTETNIFPKDLDLGNMIQQQVNDPQWGEFAQRVLQRGPTPRNGNKSDQAHPPIHPTKYSNSLQGNEKTLYSFIVRHFLACCSQDAQGQETSVDIEINDEKFSATGLMILAKNYLEVYPYDKWNAKVIPTYSPGEVFQPTVIEMCEGETSAPPLLTEADLIALMEKHGIGTDATHADHIETIKSRMYVGVRDDGRFVPGELGMGLVEGYDAMGFEMSKPHLRSELEADLKRICEGVKAHDVVLREQIQKYRDVFITAANQASKIDQALAEYFGNAQQYTEEVYQNAEPLYKCPKCGCDMTLKTKKDGKGYYVSCAGFPNCREAVWFPEFVLSASVSDTVCNQCPAGPRKKIKFKFKRGSVPVYLPLEYEGCLCGCDQMLSEVMQVCGYSSSSQSGTQTNTQTNNRTKPKKDNNQSRSYSTSAQSRNPLSQTNNNPSFLGNPRPNTSSSRGRGENHKPRGTGRGGATRGRDATSGGSSGMGGGGATRGSAMRGGAMRGGARRGGAMDIGQRRDSGVFPDFCSSTSGDGSAVVCNCGEDGRLLTVRKEGPNTGRQFYVCQKPQDSKCNFFLWANEASDGTNTPGPTNNIQQQNPRSHGGWSNNSGTGGFDGPDDGVVKCNCGTEAKSLTVNKEGPNKGRPFHGCPKPMGQGCGFFKWGDEEDEGSGGGRGGGAARDWGGGGGRSEHGAAGYRGGRGSGSKSAAGGQKRKRRCGNCGEEGHIKTTCPQLK